MTAQKVTRMPSVAAFRAMAWVAVLLTYAAIGAFFWAVLDRGHPILAWGSTVVMGTAAVLCCRLMTRRAAGRAVKVDRRADEEAP